MPHCHDTGWGQQWLGRAHAHRPFHTHAHTPCTHRRGLRVPVLPNSDAAAFTAILAVASGLALWQRARDQVDWRQWKRLPVIRQFYTLVTGVLPPPAPPKRCVLYMLAKKQCVLL